MKGTVFNGFLNIEVLIEHDKTIELTLVRLFEQTSGFLSKVVCTSNRFGRVEATMLLWYYNHGQSCRIPCHPAPAFTDGQLIKPILKGMF